MSRFRGGSALAIVSLLVVLSVDASAQRKRRTAPRPDPTLTSNAEDYAPGSEAYLTGKGFFPGETVKLRVVHADGSPATGTHTDPWPVKADHLGSFSTQWHVCEIDCVNELLLATADGLLSGLHAQTTFTDSHECGTGVVSAVTPVGSECVGFTPNPGNGPDNWEVQEGGTYMLTISGVTECTEDTITVFIQNSTTGNFCFNATGGGGEYSGVFTMPSPACHTFPISYKCGANAACSHPESLGARGPSSGCGGVHLRAAEFDASCTKLANDVSCDPDCAQRTLDFELDDCDDASFMVHGLDLESPGPECNFACPTISSAPNGGNGHAGLALFDTETFGPSGDPDLQAAPPGQGKVLILQNNGSATLLQKTGDVYDNPDDDHDGGSIIFDYCVPVTLISIDLLDIDLPTPAQDTFVILSDIGGNNRTYYVPGGWTPDGGVGTLDLQNGDQLGPGGAIATVVTDALYDPESVVSLIVMFGSSGAVDNVVSCE